MKQLKRSTFKILFYLKKTSIEEGLVFCRITIDGVSSSLSTGEKCLIKSWDSKKLSSDKQVNKNLIALRKRIEEVYEQLLHQEQVVSAKMVKNTLQTKTDKQNLHLLELNEDVLKSCERAIGTKIKASTYGANKHSSEVLKRFIEEQQCNELVSTVQAEFFDSYRNWLYKESYSPNSINNYLLWLSRLFYEALSNGYIRYNPFKGAKYEKTVAKPRFLIKRELELMLQRNFEDETLELSRHLFIFSCFTGLSFSDIRNLKKEQILQRQDSKEYIRQSRQKTSVEGFIPLHPIAKEILEVYIAKGSNGYIFPRDISRYKLAKGLKIVGQTCRLTKALSFHMGRHTFATMAISSGISLECLAKMLAHRSFLSTQIYAQVTDKKISDDMDCLIKGQRGYSMEQEGTLGYKHSHL